MKRRLTFAQVYQRLHTAHGPQHWWPADDGPFEVMVGAVLTQNTAWVNVERAIANLRRARALNARVILAAHPRRLASWLKPSGYFNVKAKRLRAYCRWYQVQGGLKPFQALPTAELRAALLGVHGVGPETADSILLYAFTRPVFVIDAYTRRIFQRLGLIDGDESYETLRALFERRIRKNVSHYNEYHALIVRHGKEICRTRPRCSACCLAGSCPSKVASQ